MKILARWEEKEVTLSKTNRGYREYWKGHYTSLKCDFLHQNIKIQLSFFPCVCYPITHYWLDRFFTTFGQQIYSGQNDIQEYSFGGPRPS